MEESTHVPQGPATASSGVRRISSVESPSSTVPVSARSLAAAAGRRYHVAVKPLAALLLTTCVALAQADKAPTSLTSAEMKQAEGLVTDFIAAKTWDEKSKVLEAIAAIDHPSKADVQKLAKRAFALAMQGPRVKPDRDAKCTHTDYPGNYILNVPSSAKRGQPTGVFICLHGGGQGEGDGSQIEGLFGQPGKGMIHVYPTVLEKTTAAWNEEKEERYVLAILDELKRSFKVDTNRVYLAGHSMGGYGTWSIGPRHADLFAAISPQAGGIFVMRSGNGPVQLADGVLPNLKNLPIWFYNSADDKQVDPASAFQAAEDLDGLKKTYGVFDFVFKKYTDIGHGTPKEGLEPIWKWMQTKKRDPLPKRVLWEPSRAWKRTFYWIQGDPGHRGVYDVQREGNKFTVTGDARGLSILLNEKMVKFDQPVIVVDDKNAELFNAKVLPSIAATVLSIDSSHDTEMWFTARIALDPR